VLEAFIRSSLISTMRGSSIMPPTLTACQPTAKKQTGGCPSKIGTLLPLRAWRNWQTRKTWDSAPVAQANLLTDTQRRTRFIVVNSLPVRTLALSYSPLLIVRLQIS